MNKEEKGQLAKIDLHCHLDGSLSKDFFEDFLGICVKQEELQIEKDCKNLTKYLEKFALPLQCLQTENGLRKAGYDFIRTVAKENIQYVEVRFAPALSTNQGLNCEQIMAAVLDGLEKGRKEFSVEYNVIACAMRHHGYKQNKRMIDQVKEFYGKGLCAFDLAGNEAAFPIEEFRQLFHEIWKMDIPFTIHGGECGRVENVTKAVDLGAQRIGQGIALHGHGDAIASP